MRITGQLIDATTGTHLWADKFDGDLSDIFDLQDKVAVAVVSAVEPRIQSAEVERAKRKPAANLDAYDLYLRATHLAHAPDESDAAAALDLLYRAISAHPSYSVAYARAAQLLTMRMANGWGKGMEEEGAECVRLARAAIQADRDDADAIYPAGMSLVFCATDVEVGINMLDRSLAMNGNCAQAWTLSGQARVYIGDNETALDHLDRARRMNPLDPMTYLTLMVSAFAHMFESRFEQAIDFAQRSLKEHASAVSTYRVLAASYAQLGRMDEARSAGKMILQLYPGYSLKNRLRTGYAVFQNPRLSIYVDGLRMAGLPG